MREKIHKTRTDSCPELKNYLTYHEKLRARVATIEKDSEATSLDSPAFKKLIILRPLINKADELLQTFNSSPEPEDKREKQREILNLLVNLMSLFLNLKDEEFTTLHQSRSSKQSNANRMMYWSLVAGGVVAGVAVSGPLLGVVGLLGGDIAGTSLGLTTTPKSMQYIASIITALIRSIVLTSSLLDSNNLYRDVKQRVINRVSCQLPDTYPALDFYYEGSMPVALLYTSEKVSERFELNNVTQLKPVKPLGDQSPSPQYGLQLIVLSAAFQVKYTEKRDKELGTIQGYGPSKS